jgi:hypothetical protein
MEEKEDISFSYHDMQMWTTKITIGCNKGVQCINEFRGGLVMMSMAHTLFFNDDLVVKLNHFS